MHTHIEIPEETKILILEGIAGAGKTTLKSLVRQQLKSRNIFEYLEEESLLGWKHIHVPHVSKLRMDYIELFLDYVEKKLEQEEDPLFIFERFHLSIKILEWEFENNFNERYEALLARLKRLPVFIVITTLEKHQIKERMYHRERCKQWDNFIQEKLALRGYDDLYLLSVDQQKGYLDMAEEQGIPFATVNVDKKDIIRTQIKPFLR